MFILLAEWLHCYIHCSVFAQYLLKRCLEVWNVSGDTSCCTMTIHFTLLCCILHMFCMSYDILLSNILIKKFKFQVLVHGIMENPFFSPLWYRNWYRESCYFTGIGTDYSIFGIVTPLVCLCMSV